MTIHMVGNFGGCFCFMHALHLNAFQRPPQILYRNQDIDASLRECVRFFGETQHDAARTNRKITLESKPAQDKFTYQQDVSNEPVTPTKTTRPRDAYNSSTTMSSNLLNTR